MLKARDFDKNGYFIEACVDMDGVIRYYCVIHKSGWTWVTQAPMTLSEQRKELRREALYDCFEPIDTSIISYYRKWGEDSIALALINARLSTIGE